MPIIPPDGSRRRMNRRFLRLLFEAVMRVRRRAADRAVARDFAGRGGTLTDTTEREIASRFG